MMTDGEIPFTDDHVEKIRSGDKTTTMRTLKTDNVYMIGGVYSVENDLEIKIIDRLLIKFGPEDCHAIDRTAELFPGTPAKHDALRTVEGFDSINHMMEWFRSHNYNLPQPFFLYRFEAIEQPDPKQVEGVEQE